jgi:hypothetical protein
VRFSIFGATGRCGFLLCHQGEFPPAVRVFGARLIAKHSRSKWINLLTGAGAAGPAKPGRGPAVAILPRWILSPSGLWGQPGRDGVKKG